MKSLAVAIFALMLAASCASSTRAPGAPRTVALDREFELRIGEEARLDNGRVNVTFASLINDSRCPGNVTCIHEGNAEIELIVTGDEGQKRLSLNTNRRMAQNERYGLYRIALTQLVPYPRTDRPTQGEDYGATLVITRG
ncbi:MAG TPA: hypothetical protein VMS12_10115 [Thermoanaerobaculia bacterium]|nr:hypothetical protein [Thermoanaerobaculia bacterium]